MPPFTACSLKSVFHVQSRPYVNSQKEARMRFVIWPVAAAAVVAAMAQTPPPGPAFEVVSIRPSQPADYAYFRPAPDGFTAAKTTVKLLIETAYSLQEYQITGGPSWIGTDEFDFAAKAGHTITSPELISMVRTMLADRFKLAMHTDAKKLPGYTLVIAKGGSKLRPATGTKAEGKRTGTRIEARHLGFSSLVGMLSVIVGQPVVDKTGLEGPFDFTLEWSKDGIPATPGPVAPGPAGDDANAPPAQGPSIFTAVQEQLGLKLEPLPGAADLYLIDRVERPTEN
jgi:bla regulator protein blaR1